MITALNSRGPCWFLLTSSLRQASCSVYQNLESSLDCLPFTTTSLLLTAPLVLHFFLCALFLMSSQGLWEESLLSIAPNPTSVSQLSCALLLPQAESQSQSSGARGGDHDKLLSAWPPHLRGRVLGGGVGSSLALPRLLLRACISCHCLSQARRPDPRLSTVPYPGECEGWGATAPAKGGLELRPV